MSRSAPAPVLVPPRGGRGIGDYTLRDFAAKWLMQQDDLAEIDRYRDANRSILEDPDPRERIVFIGDSITEFWPALAELSGPGWRALNRGIAGQNSTQMLLRFQDDVVALRPRMAVLLCGTNDLRSYAGPPADLTDGAVERIARNVTAMADISAYREIDLVLCTLPPVGAQPDVHRASGAVRAVNRWLAGFAKDRGVTLIDHHAALADRQASLPIGLSKDGVHPNAKGYRRMWLRLSETLQSKGFSFSPSGMEGASGRAVLSV